MKQAPILMYHWFRPDGTPSFSRSPQLEITPERFDRQMAALRHGGYESISLERAVDGRPLPRRPVVLTVDDGTLDFFELARPVLERHGFTATLFVVTGRVGETSSWDGDVGEPARPLMTWEQIRRLHESGHEIGSHTHSHRPLTDLSDDEARTELRRSREVLAEKLGSAPGFVAYPRGRHAAREMRLAREAGYAGACSVILSWGDLGRSGRYELRRMTIKGTESLFRFRLRLGLCRLVRYTEATA